MVKLLGGQDELVRIWNLNSGELINSIGPFSVPVRSVAYSEHAILKYKNEKLRTSPCIWIADGAVIKCYALP